MFSIPVMKKGRKFSYRFFCLLCFFRNYVHYSIYLPFPYETKLFLVSKGITFYSLFRFLNKILILEKLALEHLLKIFLYFVSLQRLAVKIEFRGFWFSFSFTWNDKFRRSSKLIATSLSISGMFLGHKKSAHNLWLPFCENK